MDIVVDVICCPKESILCSKGSLKVFNRKSALLPRLSADRCFFLHQGVEFILIYLFITVLCHSILIIRYMLIKNQTHLHTQVIVVTVNGKADRKGGKEGTIANNAVSSLAQVRTASEESEEVASKCINEQQQQ